MEEIEELFKMLSKNKKNEEFVKRTREDYKESLTEGFMDNKFLEKEIYDIIINELEKIDKITVENIKKIEDLVVFANIGLSARIYHRKSMALKLFYTHLKDQ